MKKIILTVGMSCSGKTTWAEGFCRNRDNWVNINRDDIRFDTFTQGVRDWTQYKFNNKNERQVTLIQETMIGYAKEADKNIIISDTNLSERTRNKWALWAKENSYDYEEKEFVVSWEDAKTRNNQRAGGISQSVLRGQYYKMKDYLGEFRYKHQEGLPNCILIDIDGTVANKSPERGFFDWVKVGLDLPRKEIIAMVHGLIDEGYEPIFLSGRDGICVTETYDWIMDNIMQYHMDCKNSGFRLYMRTAGDHRKDYIIKKELFESYIHGKFNVAAVLDDRPQVINNCWLEMGLPNVISVADQNLEF